MPYSAILLLTKDHAEDHDGPEIISPGIFSTEKKAVRSLFKLMVKKGLLTPFCEDCENSYEDCSCNEEKNMNTWKKENLDKINTIEDLDDMCDDKGDSYYGQNWFFKVIKADVF